MSSLVFRITGDPSSLKGALGEVVGSLDRVNAKAVSVSSSISSLGSKLSIGLTVPVLALGASVIKTASDMESLKLGLASVATASDTTEKQLVRLKEVAKLPGLGFSEAIQGSIRLQSAGFSANLAERSLKAFGNALATVGKGKADLDGVSLALSQIASKGKISAEEINQLNERVPQIRAAMKAAFGTADTEVLQKAGIGATEFVTKVVAELEKLKVVSGGTKNAMENLGDSVKEAAARVGDKLLPSVVAIIPKVEALATGAANALDGFLKLPEPIKNTALALGVLAIATGPVISGVSGVVGAIGSIKAVAGVAGAALGALFGGAVIASIGQTLSAIDQLNARYADLARARAAIGTGKADPTSGLFENVRDLGPLKIDVKAISDELNLLGVVSKNTKPPVDALSLSIQKHAKAHESAKLPTLELRILFEQMKDATGEYEKKVGDAAAIMRSLNAVTIDGAINTAKLLVQLREINGVKLDLPPSLGGFGGLGVALKDIPKFDGVFEAGDFEEFERMGKNIGELGMLTKEQFEAMKQSAKDSARGQSAALRQISTIYTDLSRNLASTSISLLFNRKAQADVSAYKNEIADLEAEQAKLVIAQQKGQNVSAQLITVQNKLADANRRMGEELRKSSFGFQALSAGKAIISDLAQSITRVLIEGALAKLASKLLDVGGIFGTVFSGGTGVIKSAVGGADIFGNGAAIGGAAKIPGVGGAFGSSLGGITGILGAVGSIGSMVSGIIGNFQNAKQETTLNAIEESTRYSKIYLGEQSQSILWSTQTTAARLLFAVNSLDLIGRFNSEMLANLQQINAAGVGGGQSFNFNINGGTYFNGMEDLFDQFARYLKIKGA